MKKINPVQAMVLILLLVTALAAVFHLTTRTAVREGALRLEFAGGRAVELSLEKLELAPVQGTVVNGKGEGREIDAQGILLSEVLREAGAADFSAVTVIADDEYSAQVMAEEIASPDKVYLIQQEEDGIQLVVFGDENSKRRVSDVVRLLIQ